VRVPEAAGDGFAKVALSFPGLSSQTVAPATFEVPLGPDRTASPAAPKERACFQGHTKVVSSVALTADGKTLATGSYDNTIKLWDVATGKERGTLTGHTNSVHSVALTPDGKTLASGSQDDTVKIWDVATGKETVTIKHGYHVRRVAFTPDGKTLISAGEGPIKLWDAATGKEQAALKLIMNKDNRNLVLALALTADGKVLGTGHGDGTIKLWDLATGRELTTLRASDRPGGHVPSLAFAEDGKTVACGLGDGRVKIWDVATGTARASLEAHPARVWGLALSPDDMTLASGAWDGTIKLWDVATGKECAGFKAHSDRVYALAFTADGKTLVSGGGLQGKHGEVKLWDVPCDGTAPAQHSPETAEAKAVVRDQVRGEFRFPDERLLRIRGKVKVLDANTLVFADGTRVDTGGGMDAPDLEQKGLIGETFYPCGQEAAEFLRKLIGDRTVTFLAFKDQDREPKRLRGRCLVGETSLEIELVRNGWAIAHHSGMTAWEIIARENQRGLWRGKFVVPDRWRKGERLPGE
jgi:endonuclease YncB( thermonuclease family)/tricorn protease-like protein